MAEIRRRDGTGSCLLMHDHLIGRGPQCSLRLSTAYVSTQHALIRWDGRVWELLDRGSRNGTQLNGSPVELGRPYPLSKGDVLTFGHVDEQWDLVDTGEPQAMVVALDTGQALLGAQGIIGLPSNQSPQCTLYVDADGVWRMEQEDGEVRSVADGQIIECNGRRFRFCCPDSSYTTESLELASQTPTPTLHFTVSSDEDFVELSLEYPDRRVELGSRAHNYLMLTLARCQLAELAANLPPASCGWMNKEEVADGLQMTPQQVDGEVFRIRKHFCQHGLPEAATIIERRPRTKQIRLGLQRVRIDRA